MFAFLLSMGLATPILAAIQEQRMSPELLWELGRVSAPQVSPDGGQVLYQVTSYDLAANSGKTRIWVWNAANQEHRSLTSEEENCYGARWLGDQKAVGFLSATDSGSQVFALNLDSGERRQLTRVQGGVSNFAWSPRGNAISYTRKVALEPTLQEIYPDLPFAEAVVADKLLYRHWDSWYDETYSHLFVHNLESGQAVDLMSGLKVHTPLVPFGGASDIVWAPDGGELCYTAKDVPDPARSTDSDLYLVNADGSNRRCITQGMNGFDREPLYSPDGKYIAFHSMQRATFESDRERLMLYDRESGEVRELTRDFDQSVGSMTWLPNSQGLVFGSAVRGTEQLYEIRLDGSLRKLTEGRHNLRSPSVNTDGSVIYALRSTMERPYEIVKVLPGEADASSAIEPVTKVNDSYYADLALPSVEEKWVTSTDGAQVHCWVIYPPGFDASKTYPMLTYCQGGPQSPITQWFSFRWNFHLMAAQDYIVLAVNRRGLPSFGQNWNDQISRDWGGQAMQDLLAATDAMFEEPYVDRQHTAAIGASFGGYSVFWLMGHDQPDRFCAMVAHCGIFNLESFYAATEELWFPDWDLGGPYWESGEVWKEYQKFSPHRYVKNWDTPLLIYHGQKDFRVPVTEGMQAFTAARLQKVPARFVYFPNEGHWVLAPQNGVLWHRIFFEWLDRWCKES